MSRNIDNGVSIISRNMLEIRINELSNANIGVGPRIIQDFSSPRGNLKSFELYTYICVEICGKFEEMCGNDEEICQKNAEIGWNFA